VEFNKSCLPFMLGGLSLFLPLRLRGAGESIIHGRIKNKNKNGLRSLFGRIVARLQVGSLLHMVGISIDIYK
jgi:hypothetical protein